MLDWTTKIVQKCLQSHIVNAAKIYFSFAKLKPHVKLKDFFKNYEVLIVAVVTTKKWEIKRFFVIFE